MFSGPIYAQDIRLMSYNIRYANEADGPDRWELRKGEMLLFLDSMRLDFLGLQEVLSSQLDYINKGLTAMDCIVEGREGGNSGEACPILYDRNRFELIKEETFWLSPSPKVPSKGWDAALNRICTYGKFRDRKDGAILFVFNTHFDHIGELARMESARLIWDKISKICSSEDRLILLGDFNLLPSASPISFLSERLQDAFLAEDCVVHGPFSTFNGFQSLQKGKRIDYCFLRGLYPEQVWHLDPKTKNGRFLSDHLPVFCEIKKDR